MRTPDAGLRTSTSITAKTKSGSSKTIVINAIRVDAGETVRPTRGIREFRETYRFENCPFIVNNCQGRRIRLYDNAQLWDYR